MGYYASGGTYKFKITKANEELLNEAVRKDGFDAEATGEEYIASFGFEISRNKDEEIDGLYFEFERYHDDEIELMVNKIAPFVESGSCLDFDGEDLTHWRFRFFNGSVVECQGRIIYDGDPCPDQ